MDENATRTTETARWVLRVAVAAEFAGHGLLAVQGKESWVPFVTMFGIPAEHAGTAMLVVGVLDIVLAVHVLIRPWRPALAWMTCWALFTALLRPLAGLGLLELVERGANVGAPLALWLLTPRRGRPVRTASDAASPSPHP